MEAYILFINYGTALYFNLIHDIILALFGSKIYWLLFNLDKKLYYNFDWYDSSVLEKLIVKDIAYFYHKCGKER